MTKRKKVTSQVEVFKVKGETLKIAFNNLKQQYNFDDYSLEKTKKLKEEEIINGGIYNRSKRLYSKYINEQVSEFTVFGCLYNSKPVIRDPNRVIMHNIVIKGTKKWETVNSYRYDTGEVIEEDTGTKAEALDKAKDLAIEKNRTVNIVVSKRLVGSDGIIGCAEFIPTEFVDDTNVYVFWKFTTKIEEVDEDDLIDENTIVENGQIAIKDDLFSYTGREIAQ